MKIAKYIREALYEHSCVIVPGFGGFLTEEKPAEINSISNVFQAPTLGLAFNASLVKDDGLLRSEVSIGEGITLEEASEEIKKFVANIESKLKSDSETSIEFLGVFSQKEGTIVYKPDAVINLNIEGFGLTNFKFEPIERNTEDMKSPRPVAPARRVAKRTQVKTVSETSGVANKKLPKEETKSSNKKAIFLILPVLLLFIGAGIIGYNQLSGREETPSLANQDKKEALDNQASILGSTSTETSEVSENEYVSEELDKSSFENEEIDIEEIEVEDLSAEAIDLVAPREKKYHAIGNVFNSLEGAKEFASKYEGSQILEISPYYKVSVKSFETLKQATGSLSDLRSEYGNDVWITKY